MQNNELEKLFGKSRVQRYKNTQEDWLYLCEKNIDISESFYRKIYIFETFLRNRIDVEFTKSFGGNWLVLDKNNINFQERGLDVIQKEIDTIRKLRNKIFYFSDALNTNFEEVEVLLTKYTKAIYNGQDFLI